MNATTKTTPAPTAAPKRLRRNAAWESLFKLLSPVLGTTRVEEKTDSQVAIEQAIEKFKGTAPLTAQVEAFRDAVQHAFLVGLATQSQNEGETLKAAAVRMFETESPAGTNANTEVLKIEEAKAAEAGNQEGASHAQ